jgi:hypothetical protein
MKFAITTLLLMTSILVFGQSKKEQIELLQDQIDSLQEVILILEQKNESLYSTLENLEDQFIDSINRINSRVNLSNDSISIVINKMNSNFETLNLRIDSLTNVRVETIEDPSFEGEWEAYSKSFWGTGTFFLKKGMLNFSNYGLVEYAIIDYNGEEYLLKLNKDVDGGDQFYMKMGVVYSEGVDTYMEVAFYEKEADGLKDMLKTKMKSGYYGSWGLYTKKQ